eukprot:TRINITY_DN9979_c3_g1_i1.p1 TRINITY_DN9979_c3_g1~~TRINITY_DN9979_c3_g1_i1.p1  ORF type:complete len:258 (+),score=79.78 TRINITY_DN9979_c3_g1_i1:3-776(+)
MDFLATLAALMDYEHQGSETGWEDELEEEKTANPRLQLDLDEITSIMDASKKVATEEQAIAFHTRMEQLSSSNQGATQALLQTTAGLTAVGAVYGVDGVGGLGSVQQMEMPTMAGMQANMQEMGMAVPSMQQIGMQMPQMAMPTMVPMAMPPMAMPAMPAMGVPAAGGWFPMGGWAGGAAPPGTGVDPAAAAAAGPEGIAAAAAAAGAPYGLTAAESLAGANAVAAAAAADGAPIATAETHSAAQPPARQKPAGEGH